MRMYQKKGGDRMLTAEIIKNIRSYARSKNINIGQLERAAGYSKGYLSRLAKTENISFKTIDAFAKRLDIPSEMLFTADADLSIAKDMICNDKYDNIIIAKTSNGYQMYLESNNKRISAAEYADLISVVRTISEALIRRKDNVNG